MVFIRSSVGGKACYSYKLNKVRIIAQANICSDWLGILGVICYIAKK